MLSQRLAALNQCKPINLLERNLMQEAYRRCRDQSSIILTSVTLCQRQPSDRLMDYVDVQTTERGAAHLPLIWAALVIGR
jgi:hypothetical protein